MICRSKCNSSYIDLMRSMYIPLAYPAHGIHWDIHGVHRRRRAVEQGSVFQSNRNQAVRLPKAVAFPDDVKRVDVVALGRMRIITAAGEAWDSWFDGEGLTADFMLEREQLDHQARGAF